MPIKPLSTPAPSRRQLARPLVALSMLGACVALAACGGSASTTKSSTAASGKASGSGSSRFASLRSCMQKQGITLPSAPSGATRTPGGPGAGAPGGRPGGFQLPKGVTQAQFQAALKKCGGNFARRGGGRFDSATARAGLVKFAACMRKNGIDVPAPNTNGKGPVFSTKGLDTSSSKFKAAQSECQSNLKGAFAPGAGGGAPPSGAPSGAPGPGAGAPPAGPAPAG